jgi:hypothetical protein
VISDYESMLDLFICHLNPSAMRRLAEKLEVISLDSEIRRHLERILRVRSTTWSQGGIFANFAAESMVPKGPEWAGGNWEIKTPATTKPIPSWEISTEVMPYMRTGEGSIPTIVADHIGIYLGMIRGRGNVVEVSEKSLVMPSNMGPSIENKPVMTLKPDDSAGGSLAKQLGLASGVAPAAEDQQAKAAEEFRRSMQGVTDNGASSDEEDPISRTKKIQIRIRDKPVSGPADVNKLKEATKSLGLVAPPGPPARTRSLTVPPPAGPPLPQAQDPVQWPPAQPTPPPAATNSGIELFGTDASTAGPQTGTGAAARPIPEDFFQNTISSLQVAASAAATLPPEGKILSQVAQGGVLMQGGQARPVTPQATPNQSTMNVGLPVGGIPPQALQVPPQVTF